MDTALILKQKYDRGEIHGFDEALAYLESSEVLSELLIDFDMETLNLLNRLNEIREIPFVGHLEKVKEWLRILVDQSFCDQGFSFSGKRDDILACYNAMITNILIELDYPDSDKIKTGIGWILKHQNVKRGQENTFKGSSILKYGGCMKQVPCYIGLVKSMIALSSYRKSSLYIENPILEDKLKIGLEYILSHEVFIRQHIDQPITKDITKMIFPYFYKTNILEILKLLKENSLLEDLRCQRAISYILKKKHKDGYYRINSGYRPKFWVDFDKVKSPGVWISYETEKLFQ